MGICDDEIPDEAVILPHRANSRLADANSKLLNERSKPLITSSFASASLGGPSLGVGSLGSMTSYGASPGPLNRSSGLGLSTEGQSSRADDFLCEVCAVNYA